MPWGDSRPLSSSAAATSTSWGSIRQASARAWPVAVTKPASAAQVSRPPRTRACRGDRGPAGVFLGSGWGPALAAPRATPVRARPRLTSWTSRAVADAGHQDDLSRVPPLGGVSSGTDPGVELLLASGTGGSALERCAKDTEAKTPNSTLEPTAKPQLYRGDLRHDPRQGAGPGLSLICTRQGRTAWPFPCVESLPALPLPGSGQEAPRSGAAALSAFPRGTCCGVLWARWGKGRGGCGSCQRPGVSRARLGQAATLRDPLICGVDTAEARPLPLAGCVVPPPRTHWSSSCGTGRGSGQGLTSSGQAVCVGVHVSQGECVQGSRARPPLH